MKDLCQPHENNALFGIDLEYLQQSIAAIPVSSKVPQNVTDLLDVAKKLLLYCYYEWDLYTVCFGYLFLVSETAIETRFMQELPETCVLIKKKDRIVMLKSYDALFSKLLEGWRIEGHEKVHGSLGSIINWLSSTACLPERNNAFIMNTLRELRNYAAHLSSKHLWPPAVVVCQLWMVTDFVNCLYDHDCHASEPKILKELREHYGALIDETRLLSENHHQNQ